MTDVGAAGGSAPAWRESAPQLIVALAVIAAVTVIGIGLLVVVDREKDEMLDGAALTALGTILGGLIQALNSPTGIGSVISAAVKSQIKATGP